MSWEAFMPDATIRIKLGHLEIDYQGDEAFLKSDLIKTVKELVELQKDFPSRDSGGDPNGDAKVQAVSAGKFNHSTSTMATLLGAQSGPDLIVAAAAHLQFSGGKSQYARTELIAAMRSAPSHFKKTYLNNLSKYLGTLTKSDDLRLVGDDTYALSAKKASEIQGKLAQAN
jgi:hypothetical protein